MVEKIFPQLKKVLPVPGSFSGRRTSDRGVALLFALGVLSALMMLGIAFINSSLAARRIAENRSHGTEAKILARSVANLVAGSVEDMYGTIINTATLPPFDLRNVFSVSDPAAARAQDEAGEFLRGYTRGTRSGFSKLDVYARTPFHGSDSSAQWVYVRAPLHDDTNTSIGDQIIGRYAYQVLPAPGYGRMSFYRLATGKWARQEEYPGEIQDSGTDYTRKLSSKTVRELRLGQSILEMPWEPWVSDPEAAKQFKDIEKIPARFADIYAKNDIISGVDRELQRAWLESTFNEETLPGFREVAPDGSPRFNLAACSAADNWYGRSGATPNTSSAVDVLMAHPALSSIDTFTFKLDKDQTTHTGLAFLNCIGSSGEGGFATVDDLRRQIAANLNDYCDADDIPTSDVETWAPTGTAPTYTGNERTLYLNEIAYLLSLHFNPQGDTGVTLDKADLYLISELIDVYGKADGSANLDAANYQLDGSLANDSGNAEIQCSVKLAPKFKIENFVYTLNGESKTGTDYFWEPRPEADLSVTSSCDFTVDASFQIQNFSGNDAYKIAASGKIASLDAGSSTQWSFDIPADQESNLRDDLIQYIREKENAGSADIDITSQSLPKLDSVKATITDFSLKSRNFVLKNGGDNADFVKADGEEIQFSGDGAIGGNTAGFQTLPLAATALFGGMEAKDPRQNLNVQQSDATHSDWTWEPHLAASVYDTTMSFSATDDCTMSGTFTDGNFSELAGSCNRVSHPDDPSGIAAADRDKETVTDPGWSLAGHISTAVIRNAPMKSPWELGFIHRGVPFQTINLKRAPSIPVTGISGATGTSYADGDGGIFDWIKMTNANYSYGRLNLNQFGDVVTYGGLQANQNKIRYLKQELNPRGNSDWNGLNAELLEALFTGLPDSPEDAAQFIRETSADSYTVGNPRASADLLTLADDVRGGLSTEIRDENNLLITASQILSLTFNGVPYAELWGVYNTDAEQEMFAGRTLNLLTANAEPSTVFRAVIVAQTIKDVGGANGNVEAVSSDHPEADTHDASLGTFDMVQGNSGKPIDNIHYDVITGEAKILVTYERDPGTGKILIRDVENLD